MEGPITALEKLDCDWSPHNFIQVNFSKLTDSNQIFRNNIVCIHYITSVKYQFNLFTAKFLPPTISSK